MSHRLESAFPNLSTVGYKITSPANTAYNCIAWAAAEDSIWWWPDREGFGYWPPQVQRAETLEAFIVAYGVSGYQPCDDGQLEPGIEKIAIYVDASGIPTHAARQLPSGHWTSKLGDSVDIEHNAPEGVAGTLYGVVGQYLKRPRRESLNAEQATD